MHKLISEIVEELNNFIKLVNSKIKESSTDNEILLIRKSLIEIPESIINNINLIYNSEYDEIIQKNKGLIEASINSIKNINSNFTGRINDNNTEIHKLFFEYFIKMKHVMSALDYIFKNEAVISSFKKQNEINNRINNAEENIRKIESQTKSANTTLQRIEEVSTLVNALPKDINTLHETIEKAEKIIINFKKNENDYKSIYTEMESKRKVANDILEKCEMAYAGSTSIGLASAFKNRSEVLTNSMRYWVLGLVTALSSGAYLGSTHLIALSQLLKETNPSMTIVVLNLLLSLLSIAPPIWLAWLATKQIGQRFRLAEDYAFKASISSAYEGFRREAARFDRDMQAKLLASALTRFDELPLRLVETDSHGSPWHELASSEIVKRAVKLVPDFAEQVRDLAKQTLSSKTQKTESNKDE